MLWGCNKPHFYRERVCLIKDEDKQRIIKNIEQLLSEILSDKYEAKITIRFSD